jgi:hypothetical protein
MRSEPPLTQRQGIEITARPHGLISRVALVWRAAQKSGVDSFGGSARRERRAGAVAWIAAGLLAAAGAGLATADTVVVENWDKQPQNQRGVPDGWQKQNWGSPKYDFTIVSEGGERAIRLRSNNDSSTITKEFKVDVRQYPILQWRWKVVTLPKGGDARRKESDDEAAQLYVTFPRFPSAVRSRIIGYIWDTTAPAGSIFPSQKVGNVSFVVIRSGEGELNRWLTETRNVLEDFTRIYGESPREDVGAFSISINSQNTGTSAEAFWGGILFTQK